MEFSGVEKPDGKGDTVQNSFVEIGTHAQTRSVGGLQFKEENYTHLLHMATEMT